MFPVESPLRDRSREEKVRIAFRSIDDDRDMDKSACLIDVHLLCVSISAMIGGTTDSTKYPRSTRSSGGTSSTVPLSSRTESPSE